MLNPLLFKPQLGKSSYHNGFRNDASSPSCGKKTEKSLRVSDLFSGYSSSLVSLHEPVK
jgi:hypothetical protein